MVLASSDRISPVPPYSSSSYINFRIQDSHLLRSCLPNMFYYLIYNFSAPPVSLATTPGITIVLFSSAYLDVSVQQVLVSITRYVAPSTQQVPPFGHLRIYTRLQLPVASRSLPRPSSPLRAKASTIRPCSLPILYPYSITT